MPYFESQEKIPHEGDHVQIIAPIPKKNPEIQSKTRKKLVKLKRRRKKEKKNKGRKKEEEKLDKTNCHLFQFQDFN